MKKIILIYFIILLPLISAYSQFSQTPVKLTFGNDRNPAFHIRNDNYDLSNIPWEFLAYERINGSSVNIFVSKINTNGAIDSGMYLTNNTFINVNPSIGYYFLSYPPTEISNSIVVWETNKNGNKDIYARIYKQNQGWFNEFPIDISVGDQTNPKTALINQSTYAIVYNSANDIKLKIINIDNQNIILDTNLTSGISQNCRNPYIMISSDFYKKLFISFEREYSSSQNSIYCLKADTISNPLTLMIDTIRFSGYNYNAGFAKMYLSPNPYLGLYESYMNGKLNTFGTEIKWNGQSSVHHNLLTSQYFDVWGYKGSEFILGDNTTNGVFGFLTKINNSIYAKAKMSWYTGDSVNVLVSNDTTFKSNISLSTANAIPSTGCYKIWIAFGKNLGVSDRGIFGISFTSCAMNIRKLSGNVEKYSLSQNYPNPFNAISKIKYEISKLSYSKLKIFDIGGKEITTLVDNIQNEGVYEVTFDASNLPSGVYFYQLRAGEYRETKKLVLLK